MSGDIVRATMQARLLDVDEAAESKAGTGRLRALISAYDVKYRIGYATWHTILMGAFAASIKATPQIPWFWMHAWDAWSPQFPVGDGTAEESSEEGGLLTDGALFLEEDPSLGRLYRSAKNKSITEWSIGYRVLASRQDPDDPNHVFVTEAELLEASLVLRGANPQTETLQVASALTAGFDARQPVGAMRVTLPSGVVIDNPDPVTLAAITGTAYPQVGVDPDPVTVAGSAPQLSADAPDWLSLVEHGAPLHVFGDLADANTP